jgi:hypothetical protein
MLAVPPLPRSTHHERDHGQQCMPDQDDRSQSEVDRADPRLIEQAAARLRHYDHRGVRGSQAQALGRVLVSV